MPKTFNTNTIPSNSEDEIIQLDLERGHSIGKRFRKIALKTFVLLFFFCLGFMISELRYSTLDHRMDDFHQFVYAYDTEQKVTDYYEMAERSLAALPPAEFPVMREQIAHTRQFRPLVTAGPFVVFMDNDSGFFAIEMQSRFPLVAMQNDGQTKRLQLLSSVEKGRALPRFHASFNG